MKHLMITAAAVMLALPAMADTRQTRAAYSLPDYVEQVGCKIVDMGGYSNVQAADGGFCEGMKGWNVQAGSQYAADLDGNPDTFDPGFARDNN